MESKPLKYKTGDLFLANRWTLNGLLNQLVEADSRWSDVGIFIVNQANPETINIMRMDADGIVIEELAEVLRDPTIQAAAYRSLDKSNKSSTSKLMTEYLKMLIEHQGHIKTLHSETGVGTKMGVSSVGSRLDAKGRDMRVSGFNKGDPNSKLKSSFTPTDLIGSALAYAKLMKYDPDVKVSDFQGGEGLLDEWYSDETPLFPTHKLDAEDLQEIVDSARAEGEKLVLTYIKRLPVMDYRRFVAQGHNSTIAMHTFDEIDGDEIKRRGADYPEQESNVISMAAIRDRKLDTNARGEDAESISTEKRLRQKEKAIAAHAKPKPGYK